MKINAGIIQALNILGLSKYKIAQISGKSKQYIGQVCLARHGVKPWEKREDKDGLLKVAEKIMEANNI